jgi:oligopeptide transport system substrate-binding protein
MDMRRAGVRLLRTLSVVIWIGVLAACGEEAPPATDNTSKVVAAAPGSESAAVADHAAISGGDRFVVVSSGAPTSLDPIKANSVYAESIVSNVYDSLFRYQLFSKSFSLRPNLAKELPRVSSDGKVLQIELRSDAYFQDHPVFANSKGRLVTAHDVIYSLKRHFVPTNFSDGAWQFQDSIVGVKAWVDAGAKMDQPIAGLKALNDHVLEIQLNEPNAMLPYYLAGPYAAVVAHEAVEKLGNELARQAVGSGPFVLKEFDGAHALLVKNPSFRREVFDAALEGYVAKDQADDALVQAHLKLAGKTLPLSSEIEIRYVSEASSILLSLQNGAVLGTELPTQIRAQMLDKKADGFALKSKWQDKFRIGEISELGSVFVSFNMQDPHLGMHPDAATNTKHRALRCAIASGYSWQQRIDKLFAGAAMSFAGAIVPSVDGAMSAKPSFNPDAAKAALKAAGYSSESLPTLRFASTGDDEQRKVFELFRAQMIAIGFPVEKITWQSFPSFGAYIEAVNRSELMLMDMGWAMDAPDAQNMLQLYYGPYKAPQVNNANYQDARFDRNFEKIRRMPLGPERTKIMQQMNQQLVDDCVFIGSMARQSVIIEAKPWVGYASRGHARNASALRFVGKVP